MITHDAAEVIKDITVASPGAVGIRLAASPGISSNGHAPSPAIQIEPAPEPAESEAVIEEEGVQVFLDPALADYLDDKVLDVEVDGSSASFVVTEQEGPAP